MQEIIVKFFELLEGFTTSMFSFEPESDLMRDFEQDFRIPLSTRFWF